MKTLVTKWKISLGMTAAFFLPGFGPLKAQNEPPLPTWDAVESPFQVPGSHFSNLLPDNSGGDTTDGFFLGSPGMLTSPPLLLDDSGMNSNDLSLFLRGGLLHEAQEPAKPDPTPSLALRDVPAAILAGLSQVPVNEYLINPQSLVTEVPAMDVERLLQFHASESRIRLYILVLDRDQSLGSIAALTPLINRLRSDKELALAIYPMGEPWRARFLVSPALSQSSSLNSMSEMAEDCIKNAMEVNDPGEQLQRFAVRLSTRLFWLEKVLSASRNPLGNSVAASQLHEVAGQSIPPASPLPPPAQPAGMSAVLFSVLTMLLLTGLFLGVRRWWRYRAASQRRHVWILSEAEVPPRLGGAFSGGAGAMIPYGSQIPPKGK